MESCTKKETELMEEEGVLIWDEETRIDSSSCLDSLLDYVFPQMGRQLCEAEIRALQKATQTPADEHVSVDEHDHKFWEMQTKIVSMHMTDE